MDEAEKAVLRECTEGSDRALLTFPQVLAKLASAGVERYHTDMLRGEKTYFLPDGESFVVSGADVGVPAAEHFSPDGIEAALKAVQAGAIDYLEFCRRILAAGCAFYLVSLKGRRAVYLGRGGETYVEPFPPQS